MESKVHIEIKKSLVLEKEEQIEKLRLEIKSEFERKSELIQINNGTITKEVENIERGIDRAFDMKSKLEAEVKVLKNAILDLVLYTPEVK